MKKALFDNMVNSKSFTDFYVDYRNRYDFFEDIEIICSCCEKASCGPMFTDLEGFKGVLCAECMTIEWYNEPYYNILSDFLNEINDQAFYKWVLEKISIMDKYEHADNMRIAIVGNGFQERAYHNLRSCGCCGFFDQEFEYKPTSIKIKFGFNYGH